MRLRADTAADDADTEVFDLLLLWLLLLPRAAAEAAADGRP